MFEGIQVTGGGSLHTLAGGVRRIDGLALKVVYGWARAHIQDVDVGDEWDNDMRSARVRLVFDPFARMDSIDYRPGEPWGDAEP